MYNYYCFATNNVNIRTVSSAITCVDCTNGTRLHAYIAYSVAGWNEERTIRVLLFSKSQMEREFCIVYRYNADCSDRRYYECHKTYWLAGRYVM